MVTFTAYIGKNSSNKFSVMQRLQGLVKFLSCEKFLYK